MNCAEGAVDQDVQTHIDNCPKCAALLADVRRMVEALHLPYPEPSKAAMGRAFAIGAKQPVAAHLISTTFALSGVRGSNAPSTFQAVHGYGDGQCRLMYIKSGEKWRVTARATTPVTYVYGDSVLMPDELGAVVFEVSSLDQASLDLISTSGVFFVPAPLEA